MLFKEICFYQKFHFQAVRIFKEKIEKIFCRNKYHIVFNFLVFIYFYFGEKIILCLLNEHPICFIRIYQQ